MQLSLYGGNPPFEKTSETSQAAAVSIQPHVGRMQREVLETVHYLGSATSDRIELQLTGRHQSISARIRELYLKGFIEKDGQALTRSGRKADCWKLTQKGMEAL